MYSENVFLRVLRFQKQQLGSHQIRDVVVDRRPDKYDVVLEEPGINVVCPLALLVCSTTMGPVLSRVDSNFRDSSSIVFQGSRGTRRNCSFFLSFLSGSGILAEPIQSFFTPEIRFHPIERSLPCQVRANGCCGLATGAVHRFPLVFPRLHRSRRCFPRWRSGPVAVRPSHPRRAILLAAAERHPVHIDCARVTPCGGKRAKPCAPGASPSGVRRALGARGTRARPPFCEEFFSRNLFVLTLAARRFEISRNLGPQFLDRLASLTSFRELIIQLGPLLFL